MQYAMHRKQVQTASGLDVLAGIWLLISPFVLTFMSSQATTNNVIVGLAVTVLASIRVLGAFDAAWLSWLNAALGLWTILSPWVLGFDELQRAMTNNVIIGIIIIALASWSALATNADHRNGFDRHGTDYDRGDMNRPGI